MMGSGYIVYVDESGDHSLTSIDADYPMFVLAFCIFPVDCYVDRVVPLVQRIKFDFFEHDMVVLHEKEIRKAEPPFELLLRPDIRAPFMDRIDAIFDERFGVVATAIRKHEFRARVGADVSPYDVALEFGIERVFLQLQSRGATSRRTVVVFESRGKREDAELEHAFHDIMARTKMRGMRTRSSSAAPANRRTAPDCRSRTSSHGRSVSISCARSSPTERGTGW